MRSLTCVVLDQVAIKSFKWRRDKTPLGRTFQLLNNRSHLKGKAQLYLKALMKTTRKPAEIKQWPLCIPEHRVQGIQPKSRITQGVSRGGLGS